MRWIERLVAFSSRHASSVALALLVASLVAAVFTATHFRIDTNSEKLVSQNTNWRQRDLRYDRLFPQQKDLILVVIDGATPELAERASAALTDALAQDKGAFLSVRRPGGGPFFAREGMLFLGTGEVKQTASQLIQAQPFLGVLAADPSLRGILESLSTMLEGATRGQTSLSDLARPIDALEKPLRQALEGRKSFLSWRSLVTGAPPKPEELRRFIEVRPRLDYGALEPGLAASNIIRKTATALRLDPEDGVRVRLTGPVPLADEEFGTLAERAGLMGSAMFAAVLLTLWLAVRSFRIILAILITLVAGLMITMALGLLYAREFNIISIAFVALFVGLGVDFAIQFTVRYRAERHRVGDLKMALAEAGLKIGEPLALAAAATAVGFLSFLPTNYSGVAELGLVAGIGMLVAFVLSIVLLPALIVLIGAPGEPEQVGYAFLRPVDRFMRKHSRLVLRTAIGAGVIAIILVPSLQFDFNPLDLRSRKVESVATLRDLMKNPETSPNTINVLAPSLAATGRIVDRLSKLPDVGQILSIRSFVPEDQSAKLAAIADARSLLDTTINPFGTRPPPGDDENIAALKRAASALRAAGANGGPQDAGALRLAGTIDALSRASPEKRKLASASIVSGLTVMLDQIRAALTAQPVSLKDLPTDLEQDWVAKDGTARIEVYPRSSASSNEDLEAFSNAVKSVAPDATGTPISIQDYGKTILRAFIQAGLLSALVITLLLLVALRNPRDVLFTLTPLFLSAFLTLATCVLLHLHLNFANVIALPLLLGVGVAFDIYFIVAWRNGATHLLSTSLTRAVIFSALTTASGFGSLWLSSHPGTASMGELLMISLGWTLITTLFFMPALLEPGAP